MVGSGALSAALGAGVGGVVMSRGARAETEDSWALFPALAGLAGGWLVQEDGASRHLVSPSTLH